MPSARVGPAANRTASSVAVAMTSAAGTQRFTTPHDASVSDVTGSLSMAISLRRWKGRPAEEVRVAGMRDHAAPREHVRPPGTLRRDDEVGEERQHPPGAGDRAGDR